jgi:GntR family transcriptional regulator
MKWSRDQNLSLQVADWLRDKIANRTWKAGEKIPSEQELCVSLNVSRGTLRNSLMILEREGFLSRRQGLGTFVRKGLVLSNNLSLIFGTGARILSTGMKPGFVELSVTKEPSSKEVASALEIPQGSDVIRVSRVHAADGMKAVYSEDYFPLRLLSEYSEEPLSPKRIQERILAYESLVQFMRKDLGVHFYHSQVGIRPENASERVAALLGVMPGTAVMRYEQVSNDPMEQPVLYSLEYCVGEAAVLNINRVVVLPFNG